MEGHIKLIKSGSKDLYNVRISLSNKCNSVLTTLLTSVCHGNGYDNLDIFGLGGL